MPWIIRTHLFFGLIILLLHVFFYFRFFRSVRYLMGFETRRIRRWIFPLVIYFNILPVIALIGWIIYPEWITRAVAGYFRYFDYAFVVPYWLGFVFVGQMFLITLALDLLRVFLFPVYGKYKPQWLKTRAVVILSLAGVLVFYIPIKTYLDTATVKVEKIEHIIPGLPEKFNGMRIVHIADVQADPRTQERKISRYIRKINSLDPHLVIHAGDLVTSGQKFIDMAADLLGQIEARWGVYSCVGDHDYWSGSDSIRVALARNDVIYKDNKNVNILASEETIGISLVTEIYRRNVPVSVLDSLAMDVQRADLRIMVSHQPDPHLVQFAKEQGYHLFLAGHTHGGQVAFGVPPFLIRGSRLETPYVNGFCFLDNLLVSVNNGLGLTLAPIRFQAPVAVSLITLRSAN